jgi:hypothetical protein
MKKQDLILGVLLIVFILVAGCAEQVLRRSYTNTVYGFSFNPPTGWQQIENKFPNVAVWFAPENSSNVSLIVAVPFTLSEGRALSTFADQVEENLSESGVNYTILYRDWRPMLNAQAYEISYSYKQDGIVDYVKHVALLKTRTVFLIKFTAPSTMSTQYLTNVDQSIDTFI